MKRTRHRPEQIIVKLRDTDAMLAAGRTMGEVCQTLGISEPTFQRCAGSGCPTTPCR